MEESDDEIVLEFILEAREILDALDQDFVQLELKPDDSKLIGNIFRGMHTLKGSSGVFAYKRLEKLAHAAESLMSALRDGSLQFDSNQASSLLKAVDVIRDIVANIDAHRVEPAGDDEALVNSLLALAKGLPSAQAGTASASAPKETPKSSAAVTQAVSSDLPAKQPLVVLQGQHPSDPFHASSEAIASGDVSRTNLEGLDFDDEIMVEFILEAREILDMLDQSFVQLELSPGDGNLIGNIFRGMHTLKGSSGVLGFKRLEQLSHAAETLLSSLREGDVQFDTVAANTLLESVDFIRELVVEIDEQHVEPSGSHATLVDRLLALAGGKSLPNDFLVAARVDHATATTVDLDGTSSKAESETVLPATDTPPSVSVEAAVSNNQETEGNRQTTELKKPKASKSNELAAAPVKVNLEVLDKLINVASEMVLARNRLLPFTNVLLDPGFSAAVRSIDLLTRELQERMMTTRMEPISQVWMKFPRLVRDISAELGKKVEVIQEGADTELDRTLLDTIRDPLVHIIRNCVDHGIEIPSARLERGKAEIGRILLRANHENGMVVIEIADDGAGIDYEAVREKIVEKNLADVSDAAQFSDSQLLPFIFMPGFSTKKTVTNLSGRGVGADVVKTNISNIGGTVEVESHRGRGTNMRLKIPLTLAIMPALFVRCQGERYAIPQNSIVEMIHLDAKRNETELEDFYGVPVFRLRGQLVPLLFLSKQLNLDAALPGAGQGLHVAILQSYGVLFGLAVDEVLDIQEVVVKSLGQGLKDISEFAGATILGDGRVALILHVDGIATNSGLVAKLQARALNPDRQLSDSVATKEVPILLFNLPGLDNLAIELSYVERLEKVAASKIQRNGDRDVVTYGDGIMPLIPLDQYVQGATARQYQDDELLSVIVHFHNDQPIGLVVRQVQDITNVPANFHRTEPPQRGLRGCVIRDDYIINILDLQEIRMLYNLPQNSSSYPQTIDMFSS
ncbi:MAG: chemotaxis protein CheA [Alcaligenaceae bacterium]